MGHHTMAATFLLDVVEAPGGEAKLGSARGEENVYSNTFSKEMLPGLIKPLVWSVNIPLVNGAWVRFLTGMTGIQGLRPEELAKQFYYRAYFNMTALGRVWERLGLPQDSLERLTGVGGPKEGGFKLKPTPKMMAAVPNLMGFLLRHLFLADRLESFLPEKMAELRALGREDLGGLTEEELMKRVTGLGQALEDLVYYNVITPLASNLFGRRLESKLREAGLDPATIDVLKGVNDVRRYYPNPRLGSLHASFLALDPEVQARVGQQGASALGGTAPERQFRSQLEGFMEDFGHVSENGNDFSVAPWREDPGFVLRLIIEHPDPGREAGKMSLEEALPPGNGRSALLSQARRSRRYALLKEGVSSAYAYGYGLYRNYFMELGRRFASRGLVTAPEDVFFLSLDEVRRIVAGGCAGDAKTTTGSWPCCAGGRWRR